MFCGHCGSKMKEVDRFCSECGKRPLQENQLNLEQQPEIKQEVNAAPIPSMEQEVYTEPTPEVVQGTYDATPEDSQEAFDDAAPAGSQETFDDAAPAGSQEAFDDATLEANQETLGDPTPETHVIPSEDPSPEALGEKKSKKKKIGIIAGIVVVLAIIVGLLLFLFLGTSHVKVPDLRDLSEEVAIEKIEEAGLALGEITLEYSERVDEGLVISQSPVAGSEVESGSSIDLTISLGEESAMHTAPLLEVPILFGLSLNEAIDLIEASGFVLGDVHEAYDDTTDEGFVISQSILAGELVEEGEVLDLLVSLGPEVVTVPDFTRLNEESARELIESSNLSLGRIVHENNNDVEEGYVISQSLEVGDSVDPGTSIDLIISLGVSAEPLGPYDLDVWGADHMATLELDGVTVDVPIPPWLDANRNLLFCDDGCCLFILERESDTLMTMIEVMLTPFDEDEDFQEVARSMLDAVESFLRDSDDNSNAVATIYYQEGREFTAGISILEYPQDGSDELISIFELVRIIEYEGIIIRTRLRLRTVDALDNMCSDEFAHAYRLWRYIDAGHIVMDN